MEVIETPANNQPILIAFGVNHKTASIEVREKLYVRESEMSDLLSELRQTLSECIILSTCNRTEIYGVHPSADVDFDFYKDLLINFKNASDIATKEHFFASVSCNACQQLFNVATSIDSKIVGDTQILQQLRRAYAFAKDSRHTGKILNQLLQRAFKIGKKTYLETAIHKGAISISLAAVELAAQTFSSLHDKNILIIGAGETAQLTVECLLKKTVGKIFVANRTKAHAEDFLADLHESYEFESEVVDFENFRDYLNQVDIVITSTSSLEHILEARDFAAQTRRILLIDIAMPRDVAPEVGDNDRVVLKNIDDLNLVIDRNFQKRMTELPKVKKLITREMAEFLLWYYALPLLPANCQRGAKPDFETVGEIKKIRQFLTENVAVFHKMSRQKDVESELNVHLSLVERLFAMNESSFKEVSN